MLSPQFAKDGGPREFGLGFMLGEMGDQKRVGHGGAVYGFATEFAALPGEKLGVVVVCSRDGANAVTTRIANHALWLMRASKAGKMLPGRERSEPLKPGEARSLAGTYRSGDHTLELSESFGRLFLESAHGGSRVQLRKLGPG
jgi:serine beta-lactamase-like protein LACTB